MRRGLKMLNCNKSLIHSFQFLDKRFQRWTLVDIIKINSLKII